MVTHDSPARWVLVAGLLLTLVLAGCGAGVVTPTAPTRTVTPTPQRASPSPPPTLEALAPDAEPRTVVRRYTDAQGRAITLYYGRGVGRRGDWGWAHIIGKHLHGEWYDGGPLTTFDVIGATTPGEVQEIIGQTLHDPAPDTSANGRREYRLVIPSSRYEALTVVGSDGAIITAYPDSPRQTRP